MTVCAEARPILVGTDKMTAMLVSHLADHKCDFPIEDLTDLARQLNADIEDAKSYRRAWIRLYNDTDGEVSDYMDQLLREGRRGCRR